MSANIYWRQIKDSKTDIGMWSPSAFIETFEEAFGQMPRVLSDVDLPVLYGIKAAFGGAENKAAIQNLIDALEKNKHVEVFAEY